MPDPRFEGVGNIWIFGHRCAEDVVLREGAFVVEHTFRTYRNRGIWGFFSPLLDLQGGSVQAEDPPHTEFLRDRTVRPGMYRYEMRGARDVSDDGAVSGGDVSAKVASPEGRLILADRLHGEGVVRYDDPEEVRLLQWMGAFGHVLVILGPHPEIECVTPLEERVQASSAEILPFVRGRKGHLGDCILVAPLECPGDDLHEHRRDPDPPLRRHDAADHILGIGAPPRLQIHCDLAPGGGVDPLEVAAPSECDLVPGNEDIAVLPHGELGRVCVHSPSLEPAEPDDIHAVLSAGILEEGPSPIYGQDVVLGSVQKAMLFEFHVIDMSSATHNKYIYHCEVFKFKPRSSSTLISKHPNLMDNVESIRGYGFEHRMVDLISGIN